MAITISVHGACPLSVQRNIALGGPGDEMIFGLNRTSDGGFVACGASSPATGIEPAGWILRFTGDASVQWQRSFAGEWNDYLFAVRQTRDGGFVTVGNSKRSDQNNVDFLVIRLDGDGKTIWEKRFGGATNEMTAFGVVEMQDRGFVVGGVKNTTGQQQGFGQSDLLLMKVDVNGTPQWEKLVGGSGIEGIGSMESTLDGGFIVAGYSDSPAGSGTKTARYYGGGQDFWVIRFTESGDILWDWTFGGDGRDVPFAVKQTQNGDAFLVGGYSNSRQGTGNKAAPLFWDRPEVSAALDFWVVRIAANGSKVWDESFGGYNDDVLYSIEEMPDNGFLLSGYSESNPGLGNKTTHSRNGRGWFVRIDSRGTKLWEKVYPIFGSRFSSVKTSRNSFALISDLRNQPSQDLQVVTVAGEMVSASDREITLCLVPELGDGFATGKFAFTLVGLANRTHAIDFSTDLKNWSPLQTISVVDRDVRITDPAAVPRELRYYRARTDD